MTATLEVWVIFERPRDYPRHFVVALQRAGAGDVEHDPRRWLRSSLVEARRVVEQMAPGAVRLNRQLGDDPVIVETWV